MFTEPKRRLAAIMAADVAGYSRLMSADEADTVAMLETSRQVFRHFTAEHGGRVVDTAGDSVLAVFDSVLEALAAGLAIQGELALRNAARAPERQMRFRIGINLGDILQQTDGSIYGDGVNIAARLEALAEPGSITIAGPAYDFVVGHGIGHWRFLGEQEVKNIARPVRVYALSEQAEAVAAAAPSSAPAPPAQDEAVVAVPPARPSIAVLPFLNMTGMLDDEYFADGITEDIITELSRFKDLVVTSRNTSFSLKGQVHKAQDIGRELNVRYLLEGSVRKAGERVRVNAQLIEARSGHHLWAERFDRRLEDVFAVQDELTRRIVSTLVGRLEVSERKRARSELGAHSGAAYDLVLRGRELWLKFNREDNLAARGLYLQAIKVDPEYPRAYASIAWTYAVAYNEYWACDPPGSLDKALEYAQTAVHLDPSAHTYRLCLGMVHFFRKDLDKAIECFETALSLNMNDADCYAFLAQALILAGEPERAVELLEHAFEINPFLGDWPRGLLAAAHFVAHRYAAAAAVVRELHTPQVSACRWFAAIHAALGDRAEAARFARRYREQYPQFDLADHLERMPFRHAGDRDHYAHWLREAGLGTAAPCAAEPA